MDVTGRCLCGAITYAAQIDAERVGICHCTDCQVNSGTAFGVVAPVVDGRFELLSGKLAGYTKIAESGRPRLLSFCATCGTRIHACTEGDPSAFFSLRLGTIDQRAALRPSVQVWHRSALPWIGDLGSVPTLETQS